MVDKSRSAEISRLIDLLDQNPGSRLFVPLAEAYLQSDRSEEAIQVLSEGLKTHPNFVAARVMLGKTYLKKTQYTEAKEQFNQVIAIAPSNIPSLKGLAEIYNHEGLDSETITAYQTILKIDPGDKKALAALEALENASDAAKGLFQEKAQEDTAFAENEGKTFTEIPDPDSLKSDDTRDKPFASSEIPETGSSSPEEVTTAPPTQKAAEPQLREEAEEDNAIESSNVPEILEPHENKTMAALYMTQGHHQEAAAVYERLLKHDPGDHENQKGLEEALAHMRSDVKIPISKTEKIERLQLWLEAIQGEKRR